MEEELTQEDYVLHQLQRVALFVKPKVLMAEIGAPRTMRTLVRNANAAIRRIADRLDCMPLADDVVTTEDDLRREIREIAKIVPDKYLYRSFGMKLFYYRGFMKGDARFTATPEQIQSLRNCIKSAVDLLRHTRIRRCLALE